MGGRTIGVNLSRLEAGWTDQLQDTDLSDREIAMIRELISAMAPASEVQLTVSKSPWRFIASIRCSDASASSGEGFKPGMD